MLRILLAAMLLRMTGAKVSYVVRRLYSGVKGKGTTVLATPKLSEARKKYRKMMVSDTDTITITTEAIVAQRHGTVSATSSLSKKEKGNEQENDAKRNG